VGSAENQFFFFSVIPLPQNQLFAKMLSPRSSAHGVQTKKEDSQLQAKYFVR
jgi:hypothetical protein